MSRVEKFNFTSWRSLPYETLLRRASSKLPGHVWKEVSSFLLRIYIYVLCVYTHGTTVHGIVSPCLNGANRNGNNTPCLGQVSSPLSGLSLSRDSNSGKKRKDAFDFASL